MKEILPVGGDKYRSEDFERIYDALDKELTRKKAELGVGVDTTYHSKSLLLFHPSN
jgi:hypothetical protein